MHLHDPCGKTAHVTEKYLKEHITLGLCSGKQVINVDLYSLRIKIM